MLVDQLLHTMTGSLSPIDLNTFAQGVNKSLNSWGDTILVIIGVALIIGGVYKIAKGLMSGGRAQVNWLICLLCLAIGGALVFKPFARDVGAGANQTLYNIGSGQAGSIVIDITSFD